MGQAITDIAQVTPELLTDLLRASGNLARGRVLTIQLHPPMPGKSTIIPLELTYSEEVNAPARLILKLSAQGNKLNRREVEFYVATQTSQRSLPTIRCYDAVYDETANSFHLLFEDLSVTHESHPPSFLPPTIANAERIIDALATLHAFWWDHPQLGVGIGSKPTAETIRQQVNDEATIFARFCDFIGDRLSDARRGTFEKMLAASADIRIKRLVNAPCLTLVHGDLHAGNFLYPRYPSRDIIRVIDWKSWDIAPGASDLANMLGVYWLRERRNVLQQPLLERYCQRLSENGVANYEWAACWQDYRWSIVSFLSFPVWQWSVGTPDFIWWHNLDRLMTAFDDLNCAELIG